MTLFVFLYHWLFSLAWIVLFVPRLNRDCSLDLLNLDSSSLCFNKAFKDTFPAPRPETNQKRRVPKRMIRKILDDLEILVKRNGLRCPVLNLIKRNGRRLSAVLLAKGGCAHAFCLINSFYQKFSFFPFSSLWDEATSTNSGFFLISTWGVESARRPTVHADSDLPTSIKRIFSCFAGKVWSTQQKTLKAGLPAFRLHQAQLRYLPGPSMHWLGQITDSP